MTTKICTKCKLEKPIYEFYFRKDSGKYRNECKSCSNIAHKLKYENRKNKFIREHPNWNSA